MKMVTDWTVLVNIANQVYTIQNISQNMTKQHKVLSAAFVIYKVAEMTNDKIILLSCLKPPYLLNGLDRICKHLRHFEKYK